MRQKAGKKPVTSVFPQGSRKALDWPWCSPILLFIVYHGFVHGRN